MNLLKNSWPPGQHDTSTLGKSEIRSGLRPLSSDYTTLLGNSLPKDMVHSRSFRYYLPSPTNSECLPHGGYMMCSTPSSYLLFAPLNHMAPLSHLCLLMSLIMKRSMKSRPSSLTRATFISMIPPAIIYPTFRCIYLTLTQGERNEYTSNALTKPYSHYLASLPSLVLFPLCSQPDYLCLLLRQLPLLPPQ